MRKDYMNYSGQDKLEITEPQCKTCEINISPTICKEYDQKPTEILLNKIKCEKYTKNK